MTDPATIAPIDPDVLARIANALFQGEPTATGTPPAADAGPWGSAFPTGPDFGSASSPPVPDFGPGLPAGDLAVEVPVRL